MVYIFIKWFERITNYIIIAIQTIIQTVALPETNVLILGMLITGALIGVNIIFSIVGLFAFISIKALLVCLAIFVVLFINEQIVKNGIRKTVSKLKSFVPNVKSAKKGGTKDTRAPK